MQSHFHLKQKSPVFHFLQCQICVLLSSKLQSLWSSVTCTKHIWQSSYKVLIPLAHIQYTVRAEIFEVVLFSRISRVKPSRKFPLQFMSIYSNDNISKIAKLTTRELPHLAKTAKITVRENNGVYSTYM